MRQIITLLTFHFFVLIPIKSFGNDSAENFYNSGMRLIQAGMWQEAEQKLRQAIESDPDFADAYNVRGVVRINLNNYEGALTDLDTAITLAPNYDAAFTNRGTIWVAKGDYEKAKRDFDTALQLNPQSINALYNRGNAHVKLGKAYHLALADYQTVLALDPQHKDARNNLKLTKQAISQSENNRLDLDELERLTKIFTPPEPPSIWSCLNPFKKK